MDIIMENQFENEERYLKAAKRVEDLKGFYGNLAAYIFVNLGLTILNFITSPDHLWFYWPLLGWGIGVALHARSVFNYLPFLGKEWEEKKLKELMDAEDRKKGNWQ